MIGIGLAGRGLSLQSVMVKKSPLKSDCPVDHSSFMTVTYSAQYS